MGIFPDTSAGPHRKPEVAPLELPRQVMRGALAVAVGGLVLTLALGMARTWFDTREEMLGALALTRLGEQLPAAVRQGPDAIQALLQEADAEVRHLAFSLADEHGVILYASSPRASLRPSWWPRLSVSAVSPRATQTVSWRVERGDAPPWSLRFSGRPQDEEREALSSLANLFGLMAACCVAMLLVMRRVIRRSFRPLSGLLAAIARLERADLDAVRSLPAMPARELDAVAAALRHLAGSLQAAEEARRTLAHQVHSLQEDERSRLAAELHDEFGQRLTALRVDAAWLARQIGRDDPRHAVVVGMGEQVARVQQEVRGLLNRLRPLGLAALDGDGGDEVSWQRLQGLLESLVAGWNRGQGTHFTCRWWVQDGDGQQRPVELRRDAGWLEADVLPRALVLALYRVSQEALTNVARHAAAGSVLLEVGLAIGPQEPAPRLEWRCVDDGIGLADPALAMHAGNGLAGMKERLWSLGGELGFGPGAGAHDTAPGGRAGLQLWARLPLPAAVAERLSSAMSHHARGELRAAAEAPLARSALASTDHGPPSPPTEPDPR